MAPASRTLAPGYTFCPPDSELTDRHLRDELAGKPVPGCIHRVDVYSADPEHLVEKLAHAPGTGKGNKPPVWYFFSSVRSAAGRKTAGGRKARAVNSGTWHQETKKVVKGSSLGGCVKTFTYVNKLSSGTPEKWIMKEFDIPPQNGGGDRVLCKIYRTPRPTKSRASASTTTSTSFVSDSGDSRKRKAASGHPDAPAPSARRTDDEDNFAENFGHVFMEGSGEFEHYYGAAAHYYGTTTHVPEGETMELPPCAQESYLPSSEFYMQGGDLEVMPSSEFYGQGGDLEVLPSSEFYTQGGGLEFAQDLDDHLDVLKKPSDYQPPTYDKNHFTENAFVEGSGESKQYDAEAHYYGTATQVLGGEMIELPSSSEFYVTQLMPGGETTQLLPCAQESFLPSSEFYWTSSAAEMKGGDIDLDELLKQPTDTNYQLSEEEIQALILEVTN